MGRVTLNPLAHIDLIGTIIFPILLAVIGAPVFGWAKPVMVNPHNLRNRRRDGMLVSAAGPISNLLVAGVIILAFLVLKSHRAAGLPAPVHHPALPDHHQYLPGRFQPDPHPAAGRQRRVGGPAQGQRPARF